MIVAGAWPTPSELQVAGLFFYFLKGKDEMTNHQKDRMANLGYLILAEEAKPIEEINQKYFNRLQTDWLELGREIRKQTEIDRNIAMQKAKDLWKEYFPNKENK